MSYEFQKRYYFWLFFLFLACQPEDIFEEEQNETSQINKIEQKEFDFNLETEGTYFIMALDIQGNILTREKFNGVIGKNNKKIYTTLLPQGEIYLVIQDENKKEIGNLKIIN